MFETLVNEFETVDERLLTRAESAVSQLPPAAQCRDLETLRAKLHMPDDPHCRRQVRAIETRLAESMALRQLGRYPKAIDTARNQLEAARASQFAPIIARAHDLLGANLRPPTGPGSPSNTTKSRSRTSCVPA